MSLAEPEIEQYHRIKVLGEGSFAQAHLAQSLDDKCYYVIKQIDLSDMSDAELTTSLNEVNILKSLDHPNIIKFREVYKSKQGKLCIVMDYADGNLNPFFSRS